LYQNKKRASVFFRSIKKNIMSKLYINVETKVELDEYEEFLEQFTQEVDLYELALLKKLSDDWRGFVDERRSSIIANEMIKIDLPNGSCLPKNCPPSKPGVYSIFVNNKRFITPICFYVGISTKDIRSRVRTHLYNDIKNDYRKSFKWLKECSEIFLCYSGISEIKKNRA
jgi:hypothetical protein